MKRKWLIALAAVLTAVLAGIFCFRDALMVRLFPKMVLSKAIGETFAQLDERYAHSPVHLLAAALDRSGCQKISMKLDTATQFMGAAHYDLELQTQLSPNRIQGTGTVSTGAGIMDLSLYMDETFFAVSSDSLTARTYYGITYDTFPQDIRSYQLLSLLAGEDVISGWEDSIAGFSELMACSYTLPEWTAEDIRTALMGVLSLEPEVKAGEEKNCCTVTFREDGDDIAEAAQAYLSQVPEALASLIRAMKEADDCEVLVTFYLNELQLTQVDAGITMDSAAYRISAVFQENDTIALELFSHDGEDLERTELTVSTQSDAETYRENISVIRTLNGVQSRTNADYSWDLSSGDMALDLLLDGHSHAIRLNLTGEGESVTLSCQEFEKIVSILTEKENSRPTICTLTVSPGEPIAEVPEYRDLSEWSMEDFMLLISRLGGLVGIKLP